MDPIVIALIVAAAIAVLLAAALAAQAAGGRKHAELAGRLSQFAEQNAATQAQLAERLQAQERELSKTMDERLGDMSRRLGESLERSSKQTATTMGDLRERLARIDAAQQTISELSGQVVGLQNILSDKQARGAFGELQLNDLVRGVLPPSAYRLQATLSNNRRADCLVHLPDPPGPIAVDAKFPLESFRALRAAEDDIAIEKARREFKQALTVHINHIAERYILTGETADAALMFLPSEAVYAELHASFPDVVELSYKQRVFVVSPTTLWATLNTVRAILQDVHMREQAGVIRREVHALLGDVGRLAERVDKLNGHFAMAEKDIRDIGISADKVVKRGTRIKDLEFDEPASIDPVADGQMVPEVGRARLDETGK